MIRFQSINFHFLQEKRNIRTASIAERVIEGEVTSRESDETGYENVRLGGVAYQLADQLIKAGCKADIRETVLVHVQRGGTPNAFDRVLATMFGVKAFEMVLSGEFGKMVVYKNNNISSAPLKDAITTYNLVKVNGTLVNSARGMGISFGD